MQEYLFNFFYWWFFVVLKEVWQKTWFQYIFFLQKSDTIPMARNFFVPLYRDRSFGGRIISIFIRFWWIALGNVMSLIFIFPYLAWAILITGFIFYPVIQGIRLFV